MTLIRSFLFNTVFYLTTFLICVAVVPVLILPRVAAQAVLYAWSNYTMWLLKVICGTRYEIRGLEHLSSEPCLIAMKHQSMWDTVIITAILWKPAGVLKKELLWIPFYGWYVWKTGNIAIDRGSGAAAIRKMVAQAKRYVAEGRHLFIFPEGTRAAPGEFVGYKPGVAALYRQVKIPCVPAAVNSGVFWPRRRFIRKPGTIVLEFLEPIEPGLNREAFMEALKNRIEPATFGLLEEARQQGVAVPGLAGSPLVDKS